MHFHKLFFVLLHTASCFLRPRDVVGAACVYTASNFTEFNFDCKGKDLAYKCRCRDPLFLGTVSLCIDEMATGADTISNSYKYLLKMCESSAGVNYKFDQLVGIFHNSTKFVKPFNESLIGATQHLQVPIFPNQTKYEVSKRSVESLLDHRSTSTVFGSILIGYWCLLVLCGTLYDTSLWCAPSSKLSSNGKFNRWVQRHISNAQSFPKDNCKRFWGSVAKSFPTRSQSMAIFFNLILLVLSGCLDYKFSLPSSIFKYKRCGYLVYVADRTAIMAVCQLPVMISFSSRNNPCISFTGWSYKTFNIFHRWIARFVWILISVHAFCYVGFSLQNNDYKYRWELEKWRWANTATISSSIALVISLKFIRKKIYEIFKLTHQTLALSFILGSYQHCKTLGWHEYIIASVCIWIADYVIRLNKILQSGGIVFARFTSVIEKEQRIEEDKLESTDLSVEAIRMEIDYSRRWRSFPGSYMFLYFLRPGMTSWQSHPFTILQSSSISNFDRLTCIVKIKKGMTLRLAKLAVKNKCKIPILIEGPYGSTLPLKCYRNAIFIAGGIGFTVVYNYAIDLGKQFKAEAVRNGSGRESHQIFSVWIIPTTKSLEICFPELEALTKYSKFIKTVIYITRQTLKSRLQNLNENETKIQKILRNEVSGIEAKMGKRPNIQTRLNNQIETFDNNTAIVSCGPGSINRDVRVAVGNWLEKSDKQFRVDYFEEELVW